jgi:hypothetical protein
MRPTFCPMIVTHAAPAALLAVPMHAASRSPRLELAADSDWKFLLYIRA